MYSKVTLTLYLADLYSLIMTAEVKNIESGSYNIKMYKSNTKIINRHSHTENNAEETTEEGMSHGKF